MSHSGSGGAVPNLTPLLDVVLQLLMFFMMCVNFVSEQVNQDVTLPPAQTARPMAEASHVLFLNVTAGGNLIVSGNVPMATRGAIRFFLKQEYDDAERVEPGRGQKLTVVIRADQAADYDKVYDLLSVCKEVGYKKLQLRVMHRAAG